MTALDRLSGERIFDISDLGRRGDGIATLDGKTLYVPYALPGETVRAEVSGDRAGLLEVVTPSAHRVAPPCRHFTVCGGCAVQHLDDASYRDWKRGLVEAALAHRGIDCAVDPLVDAHGRGRRRTTLHVSFENGAAQAGFMEARSHRLLDLDACPILVPALRDAPTIARALARPFAVRNKPLDIHLTATQTGIDCDIRGDGAGTRDIGLDVRRDLPGVARQFDLARIAIAGETIAAPRAPMVTVGPARVASPPGAFLQATSAGEATLAALVQAHIGQADAVADLFCGIGPFALRLAQHAAIFAADSDKAAIAALDAAARHTSGLKPVTATVRDLFRNPLAAEELKPFDAVVFDPPRAGARAQAHELAGSNVTTIVAVSCDPASFARDAATLIAGGYRLARLTPVDQFRHTPHVELVARFVRG